MLSKERMTLKDNNLFITVDDIPIPKILSSIETLHY
jgi:hypothetical protein